MNPILIVLLGMAVVIVGVLVLRLHAFLALVLAAVLVAALTPTDALVAAKVADKHVAERVAEGFGKTCADIGILIGMAAIIGECLLASGAAERIVRSMLRLLGEKRAPLAFLGSGYLLGIPVFFDTVFYLLVPLGKAMRRRTGRNYLLYILTIVAGATMTHSLVPPTPGPLFVAAEFKVNLGVMILGGMAVGAVTAAVGYAYAVWANRRWDVPLREAGAEESHLPGQDAPPQETPDHALPPLWLSLLPILLPVVLISAQAGIDAIFKAAAETDHAAWLDSAKASLEGVKPTIDALGNKNMAILLAALIAMATLWRFGSRQDEHRVKRAGADAAQLGGPQTVSVAKACNDALTSAGMIILITAAGGAFGHVLRQTGVAAQVKELASQWSIAILPLAWAVTAIVRTAQGSATVAMITAAGVVSPLVSEGLPFHPVYLALAVGCGSKPVMWMNDSGFWVITKMTGMRESETLKSATVMMTLMGVAGLIAVMIGAWLWP